MTSNSLSNMGAILVRNPNIMPDEFRMTNQDFRKRNALEYVPRGKNLTDESERCDLMDCSFEM